MNVTRKASRYASPVRCELGAATELPGLARRRGTGGATTLCDRPQRKDHRDAAAPTARRRSSSTAGAGRTLVLADVELKRIEDALLDALLDHHTNRDNALDRLLDDMDRLDPDRVPATTGRGGLPAEEKATGVRKARIEELLVAAVLDNHPNRNAALDRILDDIEVVSERQIAQYEMQFDNDFDGLA